MTDFDRLMAVLGSDYNVFCKLKYNEIKKLAEHLIANGITFVKEVQK